MLKLKWIFTLLIATLTARAQDVNFEQRAFDYFFSNLFQERYPSIDAIQFAGCTEKIFTEFDLYKNCFQDGDQIRKGLYDNAHGKLGSEKVISTKNLSAISFKTKKVKSKVKLHILQATEVDEKYYVMVGLIKLADYTDAYFFEFDQRGEVIRWCKTGLTH